METLTFEINKTAISLTNSTLQTPYLTGKNTDYRCVFTWSEEWDSLVISATFRNLHTNIAKPQLLTNGACNIPYEVLDYGTLEIGIIGVNGEDRIIKSSLVYRVSVQHNAGDNAEPTDPPEPTLIEQLLTQYSQILDTVDNLIVPTVSVVQDTDGEYQLQFVDHNGVIVTPNLIGATGKGFSITKTYASVEDMNADFDNTDVSEGDFVIITSNVEDEDNAKLYVKGSESFAFITDLSGAQGIRGERGYTGNGIASVSMDDGYITFHYTNDTHSDPLYIKGDTGETGLTGQTGADGKSAYQVAVDNGFIGTAADWLASLVGATGNTGKSAYQIAVDNGFVGNETAWLESLTGATGATGQTGADGKSAYQVAVDNGFVGDAVTWLASLVGQTGATGKSAYQVAVDNGFSGNESAWLASLIGATGADGLSAYDVAVETGFSGSVSDWLASLVGATGDPGQDGATGKSAYEVAVDNGFVGSVSEWLASLVGATGSTGQTGADGKSAYQVAVDNGFVGTEAQWLQSLVTSVYNMLEAAENGSY